MTTLAMFIILSLLKITLILLGGLSAKRDSWTNSSNPNN